MKGKLTDREKAPVIKEKIRKRNMQKPAESRQKEIREFNQVHSLFSHRTGNLKKPTHHRALLI